MKHVNLKNIFVAACSALILTSCACGQKIDSKGSIIMGSEAAKALQADLNKVGSKIMFKYNSSAISEGSKATLVQQAEIIKKHKNSAVVIEGNCDERGTREYNMALGEQRASASKHVLVSSGVHADKITVVSNGKEKLTAHGHSEEDHAKNRNTNTLAN